MTQVVERQESYRHSYLMKQVDIEAKTKEREDDRKDKELKIKEQQYENSFKIKRPAVYLGFILITLLIGFSIYLIYVGNETFGGGLFASISAAVLGYLAGQGRQKE